MALDTMLIVEAGQVVVADGNSAYVECEGGMLAWVRLWMGAMTGTNPTFDCRVMASPDVGVNYFMIGKFQQMVGTNDNAYLAIPVYVMRPTLASNPVRVRLNYDVGGTTPSFTIVKAALDPMTSIAVRATDEALASGAASLLSAL
jgi:hypothetical protein